MERISKQYGQEVNYLRLTREEKEQLEPFLRELGVRMRWMSAWVEDGVYMYEVQAENPYKIWAYLAGDGHSIPADYVRKQGDEEMTDWRISIYKR